MFETTKPGVYVFRCFNSQLLCGFSGREYDSSKYPQFLRDLGSNPKKFVSVKQVHGNTALTVQGSKNWDFSAQADALVTHKPGIALGIRTADCIPLFFWDSEKKAAALVHAGWRGLKSGIILETIRSMTREYSTHPETIQVALGPFIRRCCYEVGNEFSDYFPHFYKPVTSQKGIVDLLAIALSQLSGAGINKSNISDSELCTVCRNDRFYSARKEKTEERILSVMQIL